MNCTYFSLKLSSCTRFKIGKYNTALFLIKNSTANHNLSLNLDQEYLNWTRSSKPLSDICWQRGESVAHRPPPPTFYLPPYLRLPVSSQIPQTHSLRSDSAPNCFYSAPNWFYWAFFFQDRFLIFCIKISMIKMFFFSYSSRSFSFF